MFDVDVVVLWVDGNDPEWLKEKQKYTGFRDLKNRYRDWDLMKYWFRGIQEYMPWVRKIHFVTWGHLPEFLDEKNEKVNIVNHKDYMPEGSLPTYSSQALEMNIHRIEGLAEHFIYFNDDMFVTRPLKKTDFFDEQGYPRMHYEEFPLRFKGHDANIEFQKTMAVNTAVINRNFNKRNTSLKSMLFGKRTIGLPIRANIRTMALKILYPEFYTGFKHFHTVSTLKKKTLEEIWEKEPELMERTTNHKFRDSNDTNRLLADWWQLASGEFSPRRGIFAVYDINPANIDDICFDIKNQSREIICINDPDEEIDFMSYKERIGDAFECILPDKSKFER